MTALLFLAFLLLVGPCALLWGADSRPTIDGHRHH
jgi:hypothetical protein